MARPKAQAATSDDPDKLVRQVAGTYRTADERFEVRSDSGGGWFLVDTHQTNDFGQELITGPYATLAAVREAIPGARSAKVTPIRPPKGAAEARPKRKAKGTQEAPPKEEPPPPPPSWIDRLPKADATQVRAQITALEREGFVDAESVVRRDREGLGPEIATRLIERRLEAIVDELPERGRPGARELLRRAAEVLTADGTRADGGLPGWQLIEMRAGDAEPPNRRIVVRELSE